MKLPPMIILTNLPMPGIADRQIAVRTDMIFIVERANIGVDNGKGKGGLQVVNSAAEAPKHASCLYMVNGGRCFAMEPVEEVVRLIREATEPRNTYKKVSLAIAMVIAIVGFVAAVIPMIPR